MNATYEDEINFFFDAQVIMEDISSVDSFKIFVTLC